MSSAIVKYVPSLLSACSKVGSTCSKVCNSINLTNSTIKNAGELIDCSIGAMKNVNDLHQDLLKFYAQLKCSKTLGLSPSKQMMLDVETDNLMKQIFGENLSHFQRVPSTCNFLPQKLLSEEPLMLNVADLKELVTSKNPVVKKIDGGEMLKIQIGKTKDKNSASLLEYFKKGSTTEPYAKQSIVFVPQEGAFPAFIKNKEIIDGQKRMSILEGKPIVDYNLGKINPN